MVAVNFGIKTLLKDYASGKYENLGGNRQEFVVPP